MIFQPLNWKELDAGNGYKTFHIILSGYNKDNEKVVLKICDWLPYFHMHVKGHDTITMELADKIIIELGRQIKMGSSRIKYEIEKDKTELYFADGVKRDLIKVYFPSKIKCKAAVEFLKENYITVKDDYDIEIVEYYVPHKNPSKEITQSLKLQTDVGITQTSWIEVDVEKEDAPLTTRTEYNISWRDIKKSDHVGSIKPDILFYDLETYSDLLRAKPGNPTRKDMIFMNGIIYVDEKGNRKKILQIVGKRCKDVKVKDCEIRFYDNHFELIKDFCNIINKLDPFFISGYNIFNFDNHYLNEMLTKYGQEEWPNISILKDYKCNFIKKKWSSSAKSDGGVVCKYVDCPGRIWIDMYAHIKDKFTKFRNYKLDTMLKHFLGVGKVDFRYELINITCRICNDKPVVKYQQEYEWLLERVNQMKGTNYTSTSKITEQMCDDAMTCCAEYCIGDVEYLPQLWDKLNIFLILSEEANIMNVPILDVHVGAQGTKTFPALYRKVKQKDFYMNLPDNLTKQDEKTAGGNVLKVEKPGVYDYVVTLDFESLYPSIMRSENIDFTSFIRKGDKTEYSGINETKWTEKIQTNKSKAKPEYKTNNKCYYWRTDRKGVLPEVEEEFAQLRKLYKKIAAENKGTLKGQIFDIRQNTVKVLMNAMYGLLLRKDGGMSLLEAGDTICAKGREAQAIATKIAAKDGWETIYGDTDSIFIINPKIPPQKLSEEATKLAEKITAAFKAPMRIVKEKILRRMYLYKSKNYCYTLMDENDVEKLDLSEENLIISGLGTKKRDTIPLAGQLMKQVILGMMKGYTYKQLRKGIYHEIEEMYKGKYDDKLAKLMIISRMPNQYKSKTYMGRLFAECLIKDGYSLELGERYDAWYVQNDKHYKGQKLKTKEQIESKKLKLDYSIYEDAIYKSINKHIIYAI